MGESLSRLLVLESVDNGSESVYHTFLMVNTLACFSERSLDGLPRLYLIDFQNDKRHVPCTLMRSLGRTACSRLGNLGKAALNGAFCSRDTAGNDRQLGG